MDPRLRAALANQPRNRLMAGPGPYEARQSDQSALAQSMAAPVDPLLAAFENYMAGLTGQGQGGGWFGMNTVPQELNRLNEMSRAAVGTGPISPESKAFMRSFFDSPLAPGFGAMATVGDVTQGAARLADDVGITAYHGSPHTFDRFDMSKIGTGEGAQAYGHGLYFAESEDVARSYRDALGGRINPYARRELDSAWVHAAKGMFDEGYTAEQIAPVLKQAYSDITDEDVANVIQHANPGSMYEVRINANPDDFLDWDKPLSEQPQVLNRLAGADMKYPEDWVPDSSMTGSQFWASLGGSPQYRAQFLGGGADRPVQTLDAGVQNRPISIPGIKYLDAGSRAAGDGSRNYVVFDDKLIEILRRYGLLPPLAAGAAATLGGNEAEAGQ